MPLFSLHIVQHEYEWIQQLLFLSFSEKNNIYIYKHKQFFFFEEYKTNKNP